MCAKIRAAATYAIANGIGMVDATHFTGVQACATDMLGSIAAYSTANLNLMVDLGAVHIQSSVEQTITNNGVTLRGIDPMVTQIEYTGGTLVNAVLEVTAVPASPTMADALDNVTVSNIFLYGDNANVTDGLFGVIVHHSQFYNVWAWGTVNCGIHTEFAVTDTFYRPRVSGWDATTLGIYSASHTTPKYGVCFDQFGDGYQTTSGTVIDPAVEFTSNIGLWLKSAATMILYGGTAESVGTTIGSGQASAGVGVQVDAASGTNSLIGIDLEGNGTSGGDVLDNGSQTMLLNVLATSNSVNAIELGSTSTRFSLSGGNIRSVQYDAGASSYNLCVNAACTQTGFSAASSYNVWDSAGVSHNTGRTCNGSVGSFSSGTTAISISSCGFTALSSIACHAWDASATSTRAAIATSLSNIDIYATVNGNGGGWSCTGW